ncbi:MAG: electron transfer flavoprotein subunit alpha/FixB family protein [Cytophagales bacterium]|nr:electron transfer flavoprotein subunit alpha/FixB family protein [Cytophagales bacterium]
MSTLVFIDLNKSKISESSAQAATIANQLDDKVYGLTTYNDDDYISSLGNKGFDKVFKIDDFKNFDAIKETIINHKINTIVSPNINLFKELASKISIKLNFSITSNVLKIVDNNSIISSIFTGKAESQINVDNENRIYLLNKNIIDSKEFDKKVDIIRIDSKISQKDNFEILDQTLIEEDISLNDADIVISAGRGLKGPENWKMIEELAKKLNAATACSKPVSDAGWRPHHEHVGQTGLKISPKIYFAIGISGAIQHLAGVNSSKTIIVINNDPDAPFFKAADYGIVGDAFEVIPKIINSLS